MIENVKLTTSDKFELSATHYKVSTPSPGISLFHMMPATKDSFDEFAKELQTQGIGSLAIDLRGHGESQEGPNGYKQYVDEQHRQSFEDVKAAVKFQKEEGHSPIFVCGASIGANLALKAVAELEVEKAILLSAGINYRGIEAIPLAKSLSENKQVFIVATEDDVRSLGTAAEQGQKIFDALTCKKEIRIFEKGGHGTHIFKAHPELTKELIKWLKN